MGVPRTVPVKGGYTEHYAELLWVSSQLPEWRAVFAALAEFIRELIVAGTREGLAAAKARGRVGGRPTVVTPDLLRAARDMLPNPEHSVTSIAKLLGVSPGTLYNHIPNLRELRAGRRPSALETGSR
ncbi:hypothetical protein FHR32_001145 [Streptosporangium album]|uniref:Resolvase/invertase-type recombinase catalytic domain-containing protein n=1 Tax=Streptosporangium album TaxID=47479 RepID=A0A7W7W8C6_9ACTN|nr:hypothetical protein [Streptosporangium album]MBB4936840.1 hypothetical protein [Streptosporangium album]